MPPLTLALPAVKLATTTSDIVCPFLALEGSPSQTIKKGLGFVRPGVLSRTTTTPSRQATPPRGLGQPGQGMHQHRTTRRTMNRRGSWIFLTLLLPLWSSFDGTTRVCALIGDNTCLRRHRARVRTHPSSSKGACPRTRQLLPHLHRINSRRRNPFYSAVSFSPSSSSSSTALSMFRASLRGDPSYCLSSILLLSVFGLSLERRTTIGKALSAPLSTMALAILLSNVGILPFESPVYAFTNKYLVGLAVPMLLFDSDVRRIVRETGRLLVAFGMASLATLAATLIAYWAVPMTSLATDAHKVAAALCARHIGGAINFVAVAEALRISPSIVSAAIAADNVVVALYFAALFALAGPADRSSSIESSPSQSEASITPATIAWAFAASSSLVTLGGLLTRRFFSKSMSSLPVTSLVTVLAATAFPSFFRRIKPAGSAIGILMIQMFFAASGASGSIQAVLQQAPSLFWFSTLQVSVHFALLMGLGALFRSRTRRLPIRELYLASNAAVGGPTTAAAMATAKGWDQLVLPALLIGILGYAIATGLSLAMVPWIVRVGGRAY